MTKESSAAKAASIKPFDLVINGKQATFLAAGGKPVEFKIEGEILSNAIRLGLRTALQNTYAAAKENGWHSPGEKGAQAEALAKYWGETGQWARERAAGVTKEAVKRETVLAMLATVDAMDVPEEVKAALRAKFAA